MRETTFQTENHQGFSLRRNSDQPKKWRRLWTTTDLNFWTHNHSKKSQFLFVQQVSNRQRSAWELPFKRKNRSGSFRWHPSSSKFAKSWIEVDISVIRLMFDSMSALEREPQGVNHLLPTRRRQRQNKNVILLFFMGFLKLGKCQKVFTPLNSVGSQTQNSSTQAFWLLQ